MQYDTIKAIGALLEQKYQMSLDNYHNVRKQYETKYNTEWFESQLSSSERAVYEGCKRERCDCANILDDWKNHEW